jgi:hypothetical protein
VDAGLYDSAFVPAENAAHACARIRSFVTTGAFAAAHVECCCSRRLQARRHASRHPISYDSISACMQGCHGGFPNLARCRAGAKHECAFTAHESVTDTPPNCAPDAVLESSIGGITEYHSYAFGGAFKDKLFIAGYQKHLFRYDPAEGKTVTDKDDSILHHQVRIIDAKTHI